MKKMMVILLLLNTGLNLFSTSSSGRRESRFPPLKIGGETKKESEKVPEKEEFSEEKAILNYIRNEGYKEKSELRETTDITMEADVKEMEAEKSGVTYTLYLKVDKDKETVEIVDSSIKEYYDILNEIVKNNSKIRKIEVATYALGTDIIIYSKENVFEDEYREIGRLIVSKIKENSPFIDKVKVIMYTPYNFEKPLFQQDFR